MSKKDKNQVNPVPETENNLDEIMRKYDRESNTRIWKGTPALVIKILAAVFSLYCIYMTLFSTAMPEVRLPLFVGFIMILGFLNFPMKKGYMKVNSMPWYDIIIMLAGASAFFYFAFNAQALIQRQNRINNLDIIMGVIGILVLMELCRRAVGIPILCVAGALLIYAFIKQASYGGEFRIVLRSVIHTLFYTTNGVIGTPISVCYSYIILFIIFGAFLERTGIANYFISFANRIAGWSSGGPAKVAVISSALCGMVSGSSVGNTVTTGSFTIPMMKKTGYKPEFAGAVEAAASTGGQIMPPIMGAAAFLMAEYMNIPYAQVALKAILPAFLYFAGIFIAVHLEAKKLNLKGIPKHELPTWRFLGQFCYLILPLVMLVVLVSSGTRTMNYSAALAILAAIIIGFIHFFHDHATGQEGEEKVSVDQALVLAGKKTFFNSVDALEAGGKSGISVAVACGMAGIIAGCITSTGLASTLINAIVNLAKDTTIIGLVLTMLCCIVLGMGVPTTANYCIMAATTAPILIQLGFPAVAAHFFVFYFGIVADITPPVALAAYAGSAIAKSNPMKTGINATKLAIAAFVVPYIFAYNELMLFEGDNVTFLTVAQTAITALIGLFGIAAALNGFLFTKINPLFRLLLIAGGVCMMIPGALTDIIGLGVIAAVCVLQFLMKKNGKTPAVA